MGRCEAALLLSAEQQNDARHRQVKMADTTKQDAQPGIIPSYGEGDGEAASMSRAAEKDELRDQTGTTGLEQAASDAAAKVPPAEAGPIGEGTSETEVGRRLAETARRKAEEASRAKG